jgi:hypothetical protein
MEVVKMETKQNEINGKAGLARRRHGAAHANADFSHATASEKCDRQ